MEIKQQMDNATLASKQILDLILKLNKSKLNPGTDVNGCWIDNIHIAYGQSVTQAIITFESNDPNITRFTCKVAK